MILYWVLIVPLTSMSSEANAVSATDPVIARESGRLVRLEAVDIDTIDKPRIRYQTTLLVDTENNH